MTSHGPKVAGHTATLAEDEMVLIGGYDKVSGFNDKTYKYNVLTKQWSQVQTTGPYPKGKIPLAGLPYERGGNARRLAQGCKFPILISLRVFWAKRHYIWW